MYFVIYLYTVNDNVINKKYIIKNDLCFYSTKTEGKYIFFNI